MAVMASSVMFSQGVAWYVSYGLAFVCFGWAVLAGHGMSVCGTASLGLSGRGSYGKLCFKKSWHA